MRDTYVARVATNTAHAKPMSMPIGYSWVLQMTHVDEGLIHLIV